MKNILPLFFLLFTLSTFAQDFKITNFDIDLTIDNKGAYQVEETIDVFFETKKRGIFRDIPTKYKINKGTVDLGIRNINVEGHDFKITNKAGKVNIRIGNPSVYLSGEQQYKITYTISKGIIEYPEHQEFYYDLTGDEWNAKIEHVDFTIHLPKALTLEQSELKVTGGRKGQNDDVARIRQVDSRTIEGNSIYVLGRGKGITAAIKFPKRYFDMEGSSLNFNQNTTGNQSNPTNDSPWYIAIPLAILAFFYNKWKNLRSKGHISDDQNEYVYPPEGLTSAHIGAFEDQKTDSRDLVSLIPYWAAEGFLEMKQVLDETYLYKKQNLDPSFPEYEHVIFDKLFENNDVAKLDDLQNKFYATLGKARGLLTEEIKAQEYYDPTYYEYFRTWKAILFPVPMIIIGAIIMATFNLFSLGIGFILAGLAGFVPLFAKLPLSQKGATLKSEIDGFHHFIKNPDENTLTRLMQEDPTYFDKMLPFAVAFGLEKNFLKSMEPHMQYAPLWYHMDNNNRSYSSFSTSFKPEVIQSAFSSAPQSSTGSSGGGFSSGGGVGGGGGGSW